MIKIEKLHSGYIMVEGGHLMLAEGTVGTATKLSTERAISTIPELRRAIGGWCVSQINKGRYAKYTIEVKGVKDV